MAYVKQTWVDGTSVVDADKLNHIEDGIYKNSLNNDYQTSETDTGKTWIDGKPIYRKIILGTVANDDTVATGIDSLISINGSGVLSGIGRTVPFYQFYNNKEYILTFNKSGNNLSDIKAVIFNNNNSSSASNCSITIEYTKIT